MVKYKHIIKAIELYVKCPTLQEISRLLGKLSSTEKYDRIVEKGLLNEGELKHYEYLNRTTGKLEDRLYEAKKEAEEQKSPILRRMCEKNVMALTQRLNSQKKALFDYEKRLFNGFKPKEPQPIEYDRSEYVVDDDGYIENNLLESQRYIKFDEDELSSLQYYYGNDASAMNSRLYNGDYWQSLSNEEKAELNPIYDNMGKHISSAINKTEGLSDNAIVFHGGKFDVSKIVGDKINLKGYLSCSFDKSVGDSFNRNGKWSNSLVYTYEILLPKGYKGFCANDLSHGVDLTSYREEHEYLLDKNFKGKIVDIDYDEQKVTIMPI